MGKNKNRNNAVKINEDAKDFAAVTLKKYKKKNKDCFDSKKELKSSYYQYLVDLLPKTIEFVIKYGYIQKEEVQAAKNEIYTKVNDPDFVKVLKKELKRDNKIENIKLLPIMIKEILGEAKRCNDEIIANDPNGKTYDMTDMIELSQTILKKKLKKAEKAGINASLAFDVFSIIPCDNALDGSQFYRVRSFYDCLYEHAKSKAVPFEDIINIVIGEEYFSVFITFALLERKEKFTKLTDSQKTLYLDISNWCFKTMEKDLSKEEIEKVIRLFISSRKKDESQQKDSNRRYALAQLSADDYPRINKVISKMIAADEGVKKYLN